MSMYSNLNLLPSKFQAVASIVSIEHRLALCDTVVSINSLLQDLKGLPADQNIVSLIDRYFTYLDQSCASLLYLNTRALWLSNYGKALESRLKMAVHKTMIKPVMRSTTDDCHFKDKLLELNQAIATYRQAVTYEDEQCDHDILSIMNRLIELSGGLVPNHHHPAYQSTIVIMDKLIAGLIKKASVPHLTNCDYALIMRLLELYYFVSQYKLF